MNQIVTLTFSPAIDKSTTVKKLIAEKKLSCSIPKYEPGGGGINIARAIHRLGGSALAVYPAGGYSGKVFHDLLKQESVNQLSIPIKGHTRENLVVFETITNKQYRFGMPGAALSLKEFEDCLTSIKKIKHIDFLVVSGSLPSGFPANLFIKLIKITNGKNAKLVVDTSGDALKQAVDAGAYLIKPNLRELSILSARSLRTKSSIINAAKYIIATSSCEIIVVSMADKGALLVTTNTVQQLIPPKVNVKSTVGAGDSMVAGLVWSLAKGVQLAEAFLFSVACGTAATMNAGTELCHAKDVYLLQEQLHLQMFSTK